jgi:SAM-dependent methyltransferase
MEERFDSRHIGEHDWHSRAYVDQWIARDVTRDDERRPLLRQMLRLAPFSKDSAIKVLDVGAGYGVVSEEVIRAFPNALVTLQDYSEPMFDHARRRLGADNAHVSYVQADLCDPDWTARVGGPFDLVVSGLAIHNLGEQSLMKAAYRAIFGLLRPAGLLLDYDLFGLVTDGVAAHSGWLREAGFARTECIWQEPPVAIIAAWAANR